MSKVYCIVRTETDVYIPIKAKIDPYDPNRPYYLRQLPNFFGGTVEKIWYINGQRRTKKRSEQAALRAEIFEESRGAINVDERSMAQPMENGILLKTQVERTSGMRVILENYSFYLLSIPQNPFDVSAQPIAYDLNQISSGQTPAEREMDYIIQVPITDITGRVSAADVTENETTEIFCKPNPNPDVIDKFASKILSACSNILHGNNNHLTDLLNGDSTLKNAWDKSETKKAFAILAAVLFLGLNGNPTFTSEGEGQVQTE